MMGFVKEPSSSGLSFLNAEALTKKIRTAVNRCGSVPKTLLIDRYYYYVHFKNRSSEI